MANCSYGLARLSSSRCRRPLDCGAPGSTSSSVVSSGCIFVSTSSKTGPPGIVPFSISGEHRRPVTRTCLEECVTLHTQRSLYRHSLRNIHGNQLAIGEKDCARLQKLADLRADVDCQMTYLPGLACLNYPIAMRPIIEKLPASFRSKWEKEIVRYAEEHNDAYPTFREFSTMIQNEARKKNHPDVSAGSPATSSGAQNRRRDDSKRRHHFSFTTQQTEHIMNH